MTTNFPMTQSAINTHAESLGFRPDVIVVSGVGSNGETQWQVRRLAYGGFQIVKNFRGQVRTRLYTLRSNAMRHFAKVAVA